MTKTERVVAPLAAVAAVILAAGAMGMLPRAVAAAGLAVTSEAVTTVTPNPTPSGGETLLTSLPETVVSERLDQLADTISAGPEDGPGRYRVTTFEQYARNDDLIRPLRQENSLAPSGHLKVVSQELPYLPRDTPASVIGTLSFRDAPRDPDSGWPSLLDPIPTDPKQLFDRIAAAHGGSVRAVQVFTTVAQLTIWQVPTRAQRAAGYKVLSRLPKVTVTEGAHDRIFRLGLGIHLVSYDGTDKHTIIAKELTGSILSYEEEALDGLIYGPPIPAPAIRNCFLFLESRRSVNGR